MEMERVNDDTIRLLIDQEDLSDRGINFLEMMMNQGEAEDFFYMIMNEIEEMDNFFDTDAVSFQVIPHASGLEVFITKGTGAMMPLQLIQERLQFMPEDLQGFFDISFEKNQPAAPIIEDIYPQNYAAAARFDDFEQLLVLAENIKHINARASLYSVEEFFYLLLEDDGDEDVEMDFHEECARIYEFSAKAFVKADVLKEHGKLLIAGNALEVLQENFKK